MLGDNILMGTVGSRSGKRRIILFDRRVMAAYFQEASREEIQEGLFGMEFGKTKFSMKLLGSVIGQISYTPNRDGTSWRVTSVSSSKTGFGTVLYMLALGDVYPQNLTPDDSMNDVGAAPKRIWEKISQLSGVAQFYRTALDDSWSGAPSHLLYGYQISLESEFEEINLSRPNSYTIRLWEETDNAGLIKHFFNDLGFLHFSNLYIDP